MVSERFGYLMYSGGFLAFAWVFLGLSRQFESSWYHSGAEWSAAVGVALWMMWAWAVYQDRGRDTATRTAEVSDDGD